VRHAHKGEGTISGKTTPFFLAEISNWTGKVLVAPRSQLDQLSKGEEARRTGVYLLVGPAPGEPSPTSAYIGEGDNVLKRLLRHKSDLRRRQAGQGGVSYLRAQQGRRIRTGAGDRRPVRRLHGLDGP